MIELSEATRHRIRKLFPEQQQQDASVLLEHECESNVCFCSNPTPQTLERVRFAALKISGGSMDGLVAAVAKAKADWRNLLTEAGFAGDPTAHKRWEN